MTKRALSLVLSLIGVGGVGITSWISVKCSKKAEKKETKKEKVLAYLPAIISGVGTSACILGSHHISRKEIAALTASCTYLAANRDKIETKIKEKFGEDKLSEIKQEAATEQVREENHVEKKLNGKTGRQTIEETGYGDTLFLDLYLGRKFRSSLDHVIKAEKNLNYEFHSGRSVCMNDFYAYLGIDPTRAGDQFGWPYDEDYIDPDLETPIEFDNIKTEDENGELMYIIDFKYGYQPMDYWMEI